MKMRAAVIDPIQQPQPYEHSRPVSVVTVNLGAPGSGEVLVRMTAAGLCHFDL